jgi:hypothetical protein
MAMHQQVRGIGPKGGIFWGGRPTTMLALDDSLVMLQAGTLASILGAQGIAGAAIQAAQQHRAAKARDAAGDEMTGPQFEGQKRARVLPYEAITSATLEGKKSKRGRKLVVQANGSQTHLKYAAKMWSDDDAVPFLSSHLGERFKNAVA